LPHNLIRTISKSGLCSRKVALDLVMAGEVKIKGRTILDPGTKISDPVNILVNGKPLPKVKKKYILFHKPSGYVTTRKDELGRPTVYEFLKDIDDWIFPVGRLDRDSEGLLIFTNDTKFGNILTEPRYKIERTYEVLIDGLISHDEILSMLKGVDIGRGEIARPASVKVLDKKDGHNWIKISLQGGKNREIRRLFERFDKSVKRLIRTKFGPFSLGSIKPGKWIELKEIPPEISKLIK
jgi:23S rRNA pseudouridine2605 synthase